MKFGETLDPRTQRGRNRPFISNSDHSDSEFALDVGRFGAEHASLFQPVAPP